MDRKKLRDESIEFAATHLQECAQELLEWSNTGILRNGRIRELAKLCVVWAGEHDALRIAERIVQVEALNMVVKY